ncbi:U2 small nuclear ribonucleoprotein auxiliary factor 35 kDa subunit-related protein 2 [Plodia interpunctella]|uniref:U2 small nuclear ribonucleoprotein auxiliary factor 35 kDa subunit-related protein 2 n=1 Tax=Plodia interpunctella TaxID=58824 RepID=UPI002368C716|nr:U2 small nuclear ribonucleoprotein auxiliary factor 35 kDa subunit-related protein 2 [Plodia interpunctella]
MTQIQMGRHKEWRKIAKRERRRRIRTQIAKNRDDMINSSKEYEIWLREQEIMESLEYEQIESTNLLENEKWKKAEIIAKEQWNKLKEIKEVLLQKRMEQEARIKLEFELEQKRKKEQEEHLKKIEEENKKKQEIFMKHLQDFLLGDSTKPPVELLVCSETRPNTEMCPFFLKTACCRFGDHCSRNHKYPGVSSILLAKNFYDHFGLSNSNFNEYDTDLMLEYEDNETYKEFKDFFLDVLPEFEKFGRVIQFVVCNNHERHLRGNTYIEFEELRCAVAAYQALHTRWYGGRQLSLQFCNVISWKKAICGLHIKKRCPKGRACNFLHVFRNPNNLFAYNIDSKREYQITPRSWRWSESPENEIFTSQNCNYSKKSNEDKKRECTHKKSSRKRSDRSTRRKSSERR